MIHTRRDLFLLPPSVQVLAAFHCVLPFKLNLIEALAFVWNTEVAKRLSEHLVQQVLCLRQSEEGLLVFFVLLFFCLFLGLFLWFFLCFFLAFLLGLFSF